MPLLSLSYFSANVIIIAFVVALSNSTVCAMTERGNASPDIKSNASTTASISFNFIYITSFCCSCTFRYYAISSFLVFTFVINISENVPCCFTETSFILINSNNAKNVTTISIFAAFFLNIV